MTERPTPALLASALTSDKIHRSAESLSRVSPKTRVRAAERGEAMEDGSFPIRDAQDLKRAISAFGRAKDKARAKRHIVKRARALDKIQLLPESWREMASRELKPREPEISPLLSSVVPPHVVDVLEAKVHQHNLDHSTKTLSVAKATCVFRRGVNAYVANPREGVTLEQYAHARVNSFLSLLATGVPRNPAYVEDNDLLPGPRPFDHGLIARGNDFKEWEHPRGRDGKFIEKGGWVKVFLDSSSTSDPKVGKVTDTRPAGVVVEYEDGSSEVVKPERIEESKGVARLDSPGGQDDKSSAPAPTEDGPEEVRLDEGRRDGGEVELSATDKLKLRDYTFGHHDAINKTLREDGDLTNHPYHKDLSGHVAVLDAIASRERTDKPETVYRAASYVSDWLPPRLDTGDKIADKGFVSTSRDRDYVERAFAVGDDSAIFEINIPVGSSAIDVTKQFPEHEESELILPRGTQIEVVSDNRDDNGVRRIVANLVQEENESDRPRASTPVAVLDRPGAAPSGEVPVRNRGADTFPGLDDTERARLLGDLQTSAGMDAPTAERAVNTIDSFRRKYGVRVGAVGAIPRDDNPGGAMAWVEQDGTMRFDSDSIAAGVLEDNYEQGWISSNGVEGLVSHELTHMLQHGYGEKSGAKFNYASIRAETIVVNRHFDGDRNAYIRARGRFSGYAAQNTNGHEADAELLSAWTTGVQGPDWHYTWGVSFDEAYNADIPDTDLVRWEMNVALEPARDKNGPPIVELDYRLTNDLPIVKRDEGSGKQFVEIEGPNGPILSGMKVAPLVDFLSKNGYNVNRARDGSRNDRINATNGEMLGWTPATIVFDDQQSYDKFLRESGLDVFDADTSRMQWMMGNPGGAYKNAVGDYYRRSVEFAEPQYAQIAQRISDYRAGYNRAAPNIPLDTMYRQGARDEVRIDDPSVPEEVVGWEGEYPEVDIGVEEIEDPPLALTSAPSVSPTPLTPAELQERWKWVAVVQDGNVVATGRMDGYYARDIHYVRIEQSGGVWRPGEQGEISASQIHALNDPSLAVPGHTGQLPDAEAADRPDDFPAELLNVRTDDFLQGNLPPGWTRQSMDPAGINQSDFAWHDDGRGVFLKATDMLGPNGAASEVDYARLLRERGFVAPHVERGGNDNQLVVSTISGMDLDQTSQWDDVFGINDGAAPPTLADLELKDENDLWRMAVTNIAANNNDRHGGNILFGRDKDGKGIMLPIDHEIAMSGNLTGDMPDDPDAILFQIQDLPLAYDVPMQEFILNMDVDDLRKQVLDELADLQKSMESMYWVSEDNKQISLQRVVMLQKHVDALLERMQDGPA